MTNQEAIERIKDHIDIHKINEKNAVYISEALDMAISALEKQIPKKPEKCIEYGTLFKLYCPTCDTKIGYGFDFGAIKKYNDMKNCIHCGQAIDWEVK